MRSKTITQIFLRRTLAAYATMLIMLTAILTNSASAQITKEEAHAIGVDAYIYFYSLLSMDITRKQFTNVETIDLKEGSSAVPRPTALRTIEL